MYTRGVTQTYRAAVAGASGYAGGEILRLLLGHPNIEVGALTGKRQRRRRTGPAPPAAVPAGGPCARPRPPWPIWPTTTWCFWPCRTASRTTSPRNLPADIVVIDCGADHRLTDAAAWEQFYGTPHRRDLALRVARAAGSARASCAAPGGSPCRAAIRPRCRWPSPRPSPPWSNPTSWWWRRRAPPERAERPSRNLLGAEVMGAVSAYGVGGVHRHTPEMIQNLTPFAARAGQGLLHAAAGPHAARHPGHGERAHQTRRRPGTGPQCHTAASTATNRS